MNPAKIVLCFGLLVLLGFFAVESATIRDKRQINSLLSLSGESNARIENGTIICDTLKCPPESFKCVITKNNTKDDVNQIEVVRECTDPAGKTTAKTVEREPNKLPGGHFESYSEIDKNGNIASFDNQGNEFSHSGAGDWEQFFKSHIDQLHRSVFGDQFQNTRAPFRIP